MMKDLYIIGAGGFGREVAWLVERINNSVSSYSTTTGIKGANGEEQTQPIWNVKGFIDDNPALQGQTLDGYSVLGSCEDLVRIADENTYCICAIGGAKTRKKIIEKMDGKVQFATVIDPTVQMSSSIEIGEGSIICAGTIITVDEKIGNHVIINLDCTIGHDDVLDDFVTLYPSVNVSGCCHLGECVEMGTGSQIIQGLSVGSGTIVGASACVVKDLPSEVTAVGCPAKVIKKH